MLNTVSITNLKQNTAKVVNKVRSSGEPVVVIQRSKPAIALVDLDHLKMLEALEDAADIQAIRERKNEPTIPYEEVSRMLGLKVK